MAAAGEPGPSDGDRGLFDSVLARGDAWEATTDRSWLQAMLDAEAALAWAYADLGLAEAADAAAVAACCQASRFSTAELGAAAAAGGNPVIPLVRALVAQVAEHGGEAAVALVHRGATSQDILDTAAVLVARSAAAAVVADLTAAADAAAALAHAHRRAPMAARTLLQQATPTTFGLEAATWVAGLDAAAARVHTVATQGLAAQLGGAAGTLAAFGPAGLELVEAFAARLGLPAPIAPWHTERGRVAELAGALGAAAGAVGKVALDVVLLAQTEVGEVAEAVGGGSSAMPHKRNPVAAVSARAAALRAPGLVASLLGSMGHEHQRAAGAWHAEWQPLCELLRVAGSGASWLVESLEGLQVDPERMAANLARGGGLAMAEQVASALGPQLGPLEAHDLVGNLARRASREGVPFGEVLAGDARVRAALGPRGLDELLDPAGAIGLAPQLVDRILARRWRPPR